MLHVAGGSVEVGASNRNVSMQERDGSEFGIGAESPRMEI